MKTDKEPRQNYLREKQIEALNKPTSKQQLLNWLDLVLVPDEIPTALRLSLRLMLLADKLGARVTGNGDLIKPLTEEERTELWQMNSRLRSKLQSFPVSKEEEAELIAKATPLARRGMFNL